MAFEANFGRRSITSALIVIIVCARFASAEFSDGEPKNGTNIC